jgi:exodeoxyribonuclease-3
LLCLQETKAHPDQLGPELIDVTGRESFWSAAQRAGYSGTVTYSKLPCDAVKYGIGLKKFDGEGRFVVTDHGRFILYNVYFPNGGSGEERHLFKQDFLRKFKAHLKQVLDSGREVILVGDYNVAHNEADVYDPVKLSKESGFLPEERQWFTEFLEMGFVDAFRLKHPTAQKKYTWWSYQEHGRLANRGWRIDYICVSRGLAGHIKNCEILDQVEGSDHCPVVCELD